MSDVIEQAAEVIYGWNVPSEGRHRGVIIARALAAAGLLRSPRTEAEDRVIAAARAWVNAAVSAVVMWETKSDSDIAETLADAVAALDASEGGGS